MVAVGRIVVLAAGVADAGADHAIALAEQLLDAPETASGEDRGLGVVSHGTSFRRGFFELNSQSLAGRERYGVKVRQGSPRRPGHGGSGGGAVMPGTRGRMSRGGGLWGKATLTLAVPWGTVSSKGQTGRAPLGAVTAPPSRAAARD